MWDIFISHASEDKEDVARPLAEELRRRGLTVWYDEFTLSLGDNLRRKIDKGLSHSRFGVVVLSRNFFAKEWPKRELEGLISREMDSEKVILPIWHRLTHTEVVTYSPILAGRVAIGTDKGIGALADAIVEIVRNNEELLDVSREKIARSHSAEAEQTKAVDAPHLRDGKRTDLASEFWTITRSRTAPRIIILGVQGTLVTFISYSQALLYGVIFGLLGPLWIIPLGYFVSRFITRDTILSRVVGGLIGGFVGAALSVLIFDWGASTGFVVAGFFVAAAAGHFSDSERPVSMIWAVLSTLLLIACLGVFGDIGLYLDPPKETFVLTAHAIGSWILIYLYLLWVRWKQRTRRT